MASKSAKQRKQEKLVIVGAVLIIVLSVLVTLWVSGTWRVNFSAQDGYKNITFTDALIVCEKNSRAEYGDKLLRLTPDDHSNRLDTAVNQYLIFFYATKASPRNDSGVANFYVRCYVNAESGKVSEFEAAEQKEMDTETIRKDDGGGLFGWP